MGSLRISHRLQLTIGIESALLQYQSTDEAGGA